MVLRKESPGEGREAVRLRVESHFQQAWGVPVATVFFRARRFRLAYPGRSDLGVLSLGGKVAWTLCLPFFAAYVLVASILSEVALDLPALQDKDTVKPGTVRVLGVAQVEPVTSLIDALRQGRRGGWLVLAHGRAAFVKGAAPRSLGQPIWACVDGSVKLSMNTDRDSEIQLAWPGAARAILYLAPAECEIALRQSGKFA